MNRIVYTIRRTVHMVAASNAVELALDFGAGALAVILEPVLGEWVYFAAGVIVIGSLPVLELNIARVARREWKRHLLSALVVDELGVDAAAWQGGVDLPFRLPARAFGGQRSKLTSFHACT